MDRWKTRTALLVLLLAVSLLGQQGHATGQTAPGTPAALAAPTPGASVAPTPGTPAAPSACSPLAGAAATPTPFLLPDSAAAATTPTCVCGDSRCTGKLVNSRCGIGVRFCLPTGTCSAATSQKCTCGPPP
jgi:hypothetical protein